MKNLQIFNYDGADISFRTQNGVTYVNATQMAKRFGKRPNDWTNLPSTKQFMTALINTRKSGNADNQYIITHRGGENPGTWMHEDVALEFSRWLDARFAIWCNDKIKELMKTGSVEIEGRGKTTTYAEQLFETAKVLVIQERKIAEHDDRIKMLEAKSETRPHYFTIMGFATLHGVKVGFKDAQKLGIKASSLCKQEGWPVDKVPDIRWGKVGAYPDSILAKVFKSVNLNGYEA